MRSRVNAFRKCLLLAVDLALLLKISILPRPGVFLLLFCFRLEVHCECFLQFLLLFNVGYVCSLFFEVPDSHQPDTLRF